MSIKTNINSDEVVLHLRNLREITAYTLFGGYDTSNNEYAKVDKGILPDNFFSEFEVGKYLYYADTNEVTLNPKYKPVEKVQNLNSETDKDTNEPYIELAEKLEKITKTQDEILDLIRQTLSKEGND